VRAAGGVVFFFFFFLLGEWRGELEWRAGAGSVRAGDCDSECGVKRLVGFLDCEVAVRNPVCNIRFSRTVSLISCFVRPYLLSRKSL
jgi:hypothetical protein